MLVRVQSITRYVIFYSVHVNKEEANAIEKIMNLLVTRLIMPGAKS